LTNAPNAEARLSARLETIDNWIDSSITPLVIAGWPDKKSFLENGIPKFVRIQGTDIIRTWAFYTIFRSYMGLAGNKPFENIIVAWDDTWN
jgi:valyl-tRNA synthetase